MANPIWQDYFVSLGANANRYFRIQVGGTTIYSGRAYRAASSGTLYVRINDICADYMAQKPMSVPGSTPSAVTFPISFTVQSSANGSSWSTVETVDFNDDWSYDSSYNPSTMGMSFPITGRIDLRQYIFQTQYASGAVTAYCDYQGTSRSVTTASASTGANSFYASLNHAGAACKAFNCAANATYSGKTLTSVVIGLSTYVVTKKCPRYVVYYKNPFGGYDHLLMEGRCWKNASVARQTYVADRDNLYNSRETWNYQNEITESYTMNTGILTEDESSRMPYLLNSPDVFVCDLTAPTVYIPAIIETSSYDVKTRNGVDMINYTLSIRIAQNKYAR